MKNKGDECKLLYCEVQLRFLSFDDTQESCHVTPTPYFHFKAIFPWITSHNIQFCTYSSEGKWVTLPDFYENYRVFKSSWRKLLRFSVIGKNIFLICLYVSFNWYFSSTFKALLKLAFSIWHQNYTKMPFNFRITFYFDWCKIYHFMSVKWR